MAVDQRAPSPVPTRPVDAFRDVIVRFDVGGIVPTIELPDRARTIDGLVRELRPLLDAIVEADAATVDVVHLETTLSERGSGPVAQVARSRLVRARERRDLAHGRVRELTRDERTLLRYVLLRQLVRSTPSA